MWRPKAIRPPKRLCRHIRSWRRTGTPCSSSFPSSRIRSRKARRKSTNEEWCLMDRAQPPDSQPNIEEQTRIVIPIYLECAHPLHRLGEARQQEHISRSNVARHLGITVKEVRRQECKTTDLPLSVLHEWAKALGLPVAELVAEPDDSFSTPLFNRARLVRLMKTATAILERAGNPQTKRLAQTMVDQLMEIMPELRGMNGKETNGEVNDGARSKRGDCQDSVVTGRRCDFGQPLLVHTRRRSLGVPQTPAPTPRAVPLPYRTSPTPVWSIWRG